jgi:hypothetical protein
MENIYTQEKAFVFPFVLFQNADTTKVGDFIRRSPHFTTKLANLRTQSIQQRITGFPPEELRVRLPAGARHFLFHTFQTCAGTHSAFYQIGNGESFPGGNMAGA